MAIVLKPKNDTKTTVIVDDGTYKATLSNISQFSNAFGNRIGFEFTLHGAGVEGEKVMRSTNSALSARSKLAEMITGITGRELTKDELANGFDVESLIGKSCMVLVLTSKSKSGAVYSNVEKIFQVVT